MTIALAPRAGLLRVHESHKANVTAHSAHDKEQPSMTDMATASKPTTPKAISTKQLASEFCKCEIALHA